MSKHLEPISKLNAREPKMSGGGMPDRNKETYSKMPGMGCHGHGGLLEHLGLDRPDHQLRRRQGSAGLRQHGHAQVLLQSGGGIGKGFDHGDLRSRQALADQPADDGAGHVAATNECDVLESVVHFNSNVV